MFHLSQMMQLITFVPTTSVVLGFGNVSQHSSAVSFFEIFIPFHCHNSYLTPFPNIERDRRLFHNRKNVISFECGDQIFNNSLQHSHQQQHECQHHHHLICQSHSQRCSTTLGQLFHTHQQFLLFYLLSDIFSSGCSFSSTSFFEKSIKEKSQNFTHIDGDICGYSDIHTIVENCQ